MTTKEEVQALLRFLSQDAKVPLPIAMSKIRELQKFELTSVSCLAATSLTKIQEIFPDPKHAKSVLQAAKRASSPKKRLSSSTEVPSSKRLKLSSFDDLQDQSPFAIEASLALPSPPPNLTEEILAVIVLQTNRAPLHLAFAVQTLNYTYPEQPLSSRLSLAQAVVSANAKSKAKSIGIQPKKGHEGGHEEEIGMGQPRVRIMGREVPVLRRWGYDPTEGEARKEEDEFQVEKGGGSTQPTLKGDTEEDLEYPNLPMLTERKAKNEEPPLWGLDLSSTTRTPPKNKAGPTSTSPSLPIHQPTAARSYLLRSFHQVFKGDFSHQHPRKKTTAKAATQQREESAALLLHALDLLFKSWAGVLSREELDRRAWGWYVAIRPEVKQGEAGWGQKGEVKLGNILALKRKG